MARHVALARDVATAGTVLTGDAGDVAVTQINVAMALALVVTRIWLTKNRVANHLQRSPGLRLHLAAGIRHQDRRPDMLARVAVGHEVRACARHMQLVTPAKPESDTIFDRASNPRVDLGGRRPREVDAPLGEIRLSARANRVVEFSDELLGDPHHRFPHTHDESGGLT